MVRVYLHGAHGSLDGGDEDDRNVGCRQQQRAQERDRHDAEEEPLEPGTEPLEQAQRHPGRQHRGVYGDQHAEHANGVRCSGLFKRCTLSRTPCTSDNQIKTLIIFLSRGSLNTRQIHFHHFSTHSITCNTNVPALLHRLLHLLVRF